MLPSIFGENLLDNDFFNFDRDFFGRQSRREAAMMKTDVKESDTGYEVAIDLPGFKKEDVSAKLENGYLIVSATRKNDTDEKDDKGNYVRRERYYGSFSRQFYVGDDIKQEDIHAKMANGVLTIDIPKKQPEAVETASHIQIEG